ncbi:hypothetical protein DFAR_150016 [Desulfarculales bacterium]
MRLVLQCAYMIRNSNVMVREGCLPGRALGERGPPPGRTAASVEPTVIAVAHDHGEILDAMRRQLVNGRYPSQPIYGNGTAGRQITDILARLAGVKVQKQIAY